MYLDSGKWTGVLLLRRPASIRLSTLSNYQELYLIVKKRRLVNNRISQIRFRGQQNCEMMADGRHRDR